MDGQRLGNLNPSFYPNHPNVANATELPEQKNFGTSKKKVILSQCSAALAIFAANFITSSFLRIFLEIGETIDHGFYPFERYNILNIIGLIAGGIIAQIVGGRTTIILGGIVLAGGLIYSTLISSIVMLKWIIHIVSLTTGIIQGPSYVYLAEITQPNLRSSLMSIAYLSPMIGAYFITHVTKLASLNMTIYITAIISLFGSVLMFFLPDSPYWLANKGRYNRVESSLAWFRGWTLPSDVKSESTMIINNAQKNTSAFELFRQKSLYIPSAIICYVFIIKALIANSYVITALPLILGFNSKGTSGLLDYIFIFPTIAFVFAVIFISKRICFLWSLCGASLGLLVIYSFVNLQFVIWLVICYFSVGLLQVPLLLNGELFPSRLRNVGAGLGLCFIYVVQNIVETSYFESSWTIYSIIIMLVCVSMFGLISLCWLFPKNENKTLVEIEESSNSIDGLRRKK